MLKYETIANTFIRDWSCLKHNFTNKEKVYIKQCYISSNVYLEFYLQQLLFLEVAKKFALNVVRTRSPFEWVKNK